MAYKNQSNYNGHNNRNKNGRKNNNYKNTSYKKNDDIKFVNPYTFVELDNQKVNRLDAKDYYENEKLLTGEIDCTITLKTPLAILDSEKKSLDSREHATYPFYRLGNTLAIPGSTIRGELRNLYETLTNSCMLTVDDKGMITRRVNPDVEGRFNAGLLKKEKDGWVLYEAKAHHINYDSARKLPRGLYNSVSTKKGMVHGYNSFSEEFSGKKIGFLFEQKEKVVISDVKLVNRLIDGLEKSILDYRNPSINKKYAKTHEGYPGYEDAKANGVIPVWYSKINNHYYLSMASIGRTTYNKTMKELIGDKASCKTRDKLCPVCLLFGMISNNDSKDNVSLGSRVRVTDAYAEEVKGIKSVTLKELAGPKNSYIPFYLKSGENYDSNDAKVSGRKFYWHNLEVNSNNKIYTTFEKTKRNLTVEIVDTGSVFKFKVYYDNITTEQLENLIYCLNLGENNENGVMCHKIGHGKPLGLGSAKIIIDRIVDRSILNGGYHLNEILDKELSLKFNNPENRFYELSQIKKVFNVNSVKGCDVRYPYIVPAAISKSRNDCAGHQWFGEARKKAYNIKLPNIESSNQELPTFKYVGKGK